MSYLIRIVDISNPEVEFNLRRLIYEANKPLDILPEKFLLRNISSNASMASFFLVAEKNNEFVGCNAFLANDFILNGIQYTGYQSCWSATHPQHRGKKIFTTLINEAKGILTENGAGFLYGIANDLSNPIFIKKLGFVEIESQVLRIPNIPFSPDLYLNKTAFLNSAGACVIDERQVMEHKLLQYPADVKVIRFNQSWLWGKLLTKQKLGIKWPVFYVGGVCLETEKDLKELISEIYRSYSVAFVQFFSCATNTFIPMLKGWKKSKMNGFIFYNLNMPPPDHLNFMIGPLDIF